MGARKKDLPPSRDLVACFTPFLMHLPVLSYPKDLSKRTSTASGLSTARLSATRTKTFTKEDAAQQLIRGIHQGGDR